MQSQALSEKFTENISNHLLSIKESISCVIWYEI